VDVYVPFRPAPTVLRFFRLFPRSVGWSVGWGLSGEGRKEGRGLGGWGKGGGGVRRGRREERTRNNRKREPTFAMTGIALLTGIA
jgi:hypothetical protein